MDSRRIRMDHWTLVAKPEHMSALLAKLVSIAEAPPLGTLRLDVLVSNDYEFNIILVHSYTEVGAALIWDTGIQSNMSDSPVVLEFELIPPQADALRCPALASPTLAPKKAVDSTGTELCPVFLVHFFISSRVSDDFEHLILHESNAVRELERGNMRFDLFKSRSVSQPSEPISRYLVYEVLETVEALAEHSRSEHYLHARNSLPALQARPRSHDKGYRIVYPVQIDAWRTPY